MENNKNINTSFDYMLNVETKYPIESDNYKIEYNTEDKKVLGIFERLSWDISKQTKFTVGSIYLNGNNKPIDLTTSTNNKILNDVKDKFNTQQSISGKSATNRILSYENIFNVIGTLKKEDEVYNERETKYKKLYDTNFSKYIYRARRKNFTNVRESKDKTGWIVYLNNLTNIVPPIFSFDTNTNSKVNAYVKFRNIEVPMRLVKTSVHGGLDSYIAIYPEYLLTKYKDFIDSIMYIKIECDSIHENKVYFDYLINDNDNKELLFIPVSTHIQNLGNLRSNRTFFSIINNFIYYYNDKREG